MTPDKLWDAALGELELELSKANFTTWLDKTFMISADSGNIIVGVPNAFTKTWLENKYHDSIVKALRRISDDPINHVSYQVGTPTDVVHVEEPEPVVQPLHVEKPKEDAILTTEPQAPITQSGGHATVTITQNTDPASAPAGLNPRYTFESYIVGKKNELAHAACIAIAERPGTVYNPLFIYGGVGLGKTHLMQAVGNAVKKRNNDAKVLYVTCETFTNEYIKQVGEGRADEFKNKYRSVDILMVDDIQFLAGKEGTQEAFFHTFNHLHQHNKQIIITSDRPPRAIATLEDRLVSRFEGGMLVDVNTPDLETRIAILRLKCQEKGVDLPQEVLQFVATNVQNNIRELEGALNRIIAHHQLKNERITLESAKSILSSFSHKPKRTSLTTKRIAAIVSDYFDIDIEEMRGNSRKKELVTPRQIAMYLMREEINASYPNIGSELGGRDHTTAMHACQKIKKLIEEDEKMQNDISMIKERLFNS